MDTSQTDHTSSTHDVSFVYLLVSSDHSRFKIGFSIDPVQRLKNFATKIDLESSMQVSCPLADVRRLETVLHAWFADYRIDRDLIDDIQGRTEWFDYRCWPAVISYLTEHRGWLRCTEPTAINPLSMGRSAKRPPARPGIARRGQVRREHVTIVLGMVGSMAEIMTKAESMTGKSIINKAVVLRLADAATAEDTQVAFGRILWEAAALQSRGIVKIDNLDLIGLGLTFTRLTDVQFDTAELYEIKPVGNPRRRTQHAWG